MRTLTRAPSHRPLFCSVLSHRTVLSDDLPIHLITGRVLMKPHVRELTGTSAIFEDGTEENIDAVVFATGYAWTLPFVENDSAILDRQRSLFKLVFPPQLAKPTLAFIGMFQPKGALIPSAELQSRWTVQVFKGQKQLPSENDMMADIARGRRKMEKEFMESSGQRHHVSYIDYMDEIASQLGVKPNLFSLLFWDTKLAKEIFYGPCTSYQYRLQGPGKWTGARKAILTQRDRMRKPLRARVIQPSEFSSPDVFWNQSSNKFLTVIILEGWATEQADLSQVHSLLLRGLAIFAAKGYVMASLQKTNCAFKTMKSPSHSQECSTCSKSRGHVAITWPTGLYMKGTLEKRVACDSVDQVGKTHPSVDIKVKKIAVIGAGICGLGAIKCCLDEGLEPLCFEKSNDIGGLWRYEETPECGRPGIYRSLTSNTSKEMMAFSDYPFPDHFPNYLHNTKVMQYLRMYAKHFGLMEHIQFQSKVCSVRKRPEFSSSGQWDVVVETDGQQNTYVFDGVMVCSGHYTEKHLPLQDFAGIEKFRGRYLHSWEYKHPDSFVGKRVVVVGIGNSGADVAGEIGRVAEQVFLSTRRGAWTWFRVWDNGNPVDTTLFTRYNRTLNKFTPKFLINRWMENKLNAKFNHANYGLQPKHRFLNYQSTFGDDLPNHIITGRVLVKPNVKEFSATSAIFEDGTEEDIDAVVFSTGYSLSFPFLDDDSAILDSQHSMFKFVFPPQLEKPTLAFIGILHPVGAIIPTSEIQSRWAVSVFKGLKKLPSESDMMASIARRRKKTAKEFAGSSRFLCRVNYIDYMDEIASELGVKPNLFSLLLRDTELAKEIFYGPCTPYQYRLQGPGKWTGARKAILTQRDRILKPLRTRMPPTPGISWVTFVQRSQENDFLGRFGDERSLHATPSPVGVHAWRLLGGGSCRVTKFSPRAPRGAARQPDGRLRLARLPRPSGAPGRQRASASRCVPTAENNNNKPARSGRAPRGADPERGAGAAGRRRPLPEAGAG
ncbi:flavin-containing monooxygenase 5-like [Ctenodactylus gundi]